MNRKAFFLDRDGVLNKEIGYIKNWDKIRFYKGTFSALRRIEKKGYLIIIVTNQSIIARKIAKKIEIAKLHNKLIQYLKNKKINITEIFFCPHHPEYTGKCKCRKPNNHLIIKAIKKYNIDKKESWFVGDKTSDILAGKRSGLKTVLVKTGYGGLDKKYKVKPDHVFKNLFKMSSQILIKNGI